jgi:hypothetical protein
MKGRTGKLVDATPQEVEAARKRKGGSNAEYAVQFEQDSSPVTVRGADATLLPYSIHLVPYSIRYTHCTPCTLQVLGADLVTQMIPAAVRRLQQLTGMDDNAIADSVVLYWHEQKQKVLMTGQIIEDDNEDDNYKSLYKQVIKKLNSWKAQSQGSKCAVDITGGKKSVNSCICLAASNVSDVDLYYMDYHGSFDKKLNRPMFGDSYLAHLPHTDLSTGSIHLKKGKDFFKVLPTAYPQCYL